LPEPVPLVGYGEGMIVSYNFVLPFAIAERASLTLQEQLSNRIVFNV